MTPHAYQNQSNDGVSILEETLRKVISELPPLPSTIGYYDDFDSTTRYISDFEEILVAKVHRNGSKENLYFESSCYEYRIFLKSFLVFLLSKNLTIVSVIQIYSSVEALIDVDLTEVLTVAPANIKQTWLALRTKEFPSATYNGIKWILKFKCHYLIDDWSKATEILISSLPCPAVDKYSSLRNENTFLSEKEEAQIIHYLDQVSNDIQSSEIKDRSFANECALLFSFHFGLRPIQIANIKIKDVKLFEILDSTTPPVHLTIQMAKQKTKSRAISFVRKLKQEWSCIVAAHYRYMVGLDRLASERFLEVKSASEMSLVISTTATNIVKRKISATNMRHSAAQRLVNSGASQDEVATFLSHTDIDTCLSYFNDSPSQAKALNDALMISATYSTVKRIAESKYISEKELRELKSEMQIGGMPHGIPITGIGACTVGQPNCKYNPISACYGCDNFMPLNDKVMHENVLKDFRSVVTFFHKSDKSYKKSAAFSQLRRTLSDIKDVISDLN